MANFGSTWGKLKWGAGRWGFPSLFGGNLAGGATITALGTLTATPDNFIRSGSASIVGLGLLTGVGGKIVTTATSIIGLGTLSVTPGLLKIGGASIVALGILYNRIPGTRDASLLTVLWPRANPTFMIPIAYVTLLKNLNSPEKNQSTEPTAIVEIMGSPYNNE